MPGPPPKPYLIKKAEGNPGHQKLNPGPQFTLGIPKPPAALRSAGRKLWKRLARQLHEQGLMTEEFGPELEGLCFNYGCAIETETFLRKNGRTYKTKTGIWKARPEVAMVQNAWHAVNTFAAKFGLSPADQGKIVVPNVKKPEIKDRLLS